MAEDTGASSRPKKDLLRFLTCGAVDAGKSTLIGRLLFDSQLILDDHLAALRASGPAAGRAEENPDFALLVDGLEAEREQGITIDVAYRYFATARRKFIVADTPGHEQYTRNMATGASNADLAVLLVDARMGVLTQTRRQSSIVHLLDIRHVVLAVNKMDLAGFSERRFKEICEDYAAFAGKLGLKSVFALPLAARDGDNVVSGGSRMPWYRGPALLAYLEAVDVSRPFEDKPFRMPVQWVNRPNADFRGYAGTIASGSIRPGSPVVALPSGRSSSVRQVLSGGRALDEASAGRAVTLLLEDEIDVGRGDVLAAPGDRPELSDQVAAHIVWMGDEPLLPGRQYLMKCGAQTAPGSVTAVKHKLDVDHLEETPGHGLSLNEIGFCNVSFSRPIVYEPYLTNRSMGGFIVIDRVSKATVGAGLIRFGLRRATNVSWQALDVNKAARAALNGQRPVCLWFTGLSGSGKSTLANLLEKRLHAEGRHTYILDGDNIRHGLNRDLGFTDADRVENIRRVGEVARLMVDAGLIVIVAFISPFRAERRTARELFSEGEFIEVFVDTPLAICERRDTKGLYKKARAGLLRNFTGIDSAYEPPEQPEIHLMGGDGSPEQLLEQIRLALGQYPIR